MSEIIRAREGWRRVALVLCVLLAAGCLFLVLGVTVWAQDQQPAEQTTEGQQPAEQSTGSGETTSQPAQQKKDGLVIQYWEPEVGTKTVYHINDWINDEHGDYYDTWTLGYWDDVQLYAAENPKPPVNWSSSYYKSVEATSNMYPLYFGLEGPWYFNMTTPYKIIEEVVGIHEAMDAFEFPQATYAVRRTYVGSGGHRFVITTYMSNDSTASEWHEWGYTEEYFPEGSTSSTKKTVRYLSPFDKSTPVSATTTFPIQVGDTGSKSQIHLSSGSEVYGATFKVVSEGKITTPGGAYDALLIRYDYGLPESRVNATRIEYNWFVQGLGLVAGIKSLPNVLGPAYDEATGYYSVRQDKVWYNSTGIWVLKSFQGPGATKQ